GGRYLSEDRLHGEIARSAGKYGGVELPWSGKSEWADGGGHQTKATPAPQPVQPPPLPPPSPPSEPEDPELDEDDDDELDEDDDADLDEGSQSSLSCRRSTCTAVLIRGRPRHGS